MRRLALFRMDCCPNANLMQSAVRNSTNVAPLQSNLPGLEVLTRLTVARDVHLDKLLPGKRTLELTERILSCTQLAHRVGNNI